MKKNRMLRMASALLILTLLTTSVIGGTFAKYVSEGSVSDTARVAKWGVEIKTSGTLYSDAYAKKSDDTGTSNLPATWAANPTADSITVAASTQNDNIVAPGTKSYADGLNFSISGKPEVAVKVSTTIEAEDIFLAKGTYGVLVPVVVDNTDSLHTIIKSSGTVYSIAKTSPSGYAKVADNAAYSSDNNYYIFTNKVDVGDDGYFPVKYKLTQGTTEVTDKKAIDAALEFVKKLDSNKNADSTYDYKVSYTANGSVIKANTDLSNTTNGFANEKLEWAWAYESGSDDTTKKATDAKDTLLGDLMAMRAAKAASGNVDYVVVGIATDTTTGNETITALEVQTAADDYTVKKGNDVVANLRTLFNITLKVEQVD